MFFPLPDRQTPAPRSTQPSASVASYVAFWGGGLTIGDGNQTGDRSDNNI